MGQQIRHIAIRATDQEAVKKFYIDTFGMRQVQHEAGGRAIYLSDGHVTLAILPGKPGLKEGIDHFGFQVDNMEKTGKAAAAAGGSPKLETRPRDGRYAEFRVCDPVGSEIDLSETGWKSA